jgi:serine dehydrogenase proteinase
MPRVARKSRPLTYSTLLEETSQGHTIREPLFRRLEKQLGPNKKVVAFFTSFKWPVILEDPDADMLEEVLQNSSMQGKELVLLLNSPGGDALAAERIVNICRSFSKGGFSVIVPKMAKSAATMVCFGAKKIILSKTSELGPIDPQIPIRDDRGNAYKYLAAHEILESYEELMSKANRTTRRVEPYLQQLARFDARDIRSIQSAVQLSESIAVKCLREGILSRLNNAKIRAKIKPFLDPKHTKVHGPPIYYDTVRDCGLDQQVYDIKDVVWQTVWQLYVRLNYVVSNVSVGSAKIVESSEDFYQMPIPPFLQEDFNASNHGREAEP